MDSYINFVNKTFPNPNSNIYNIVSVHIGHIVGIFSLFRINFVFRKAPPLPSSSLLCLLENMKYNLNEKGLISPEHATKDTNKYKDK